MTSYKGNRSQLNSAAFCLAVLTMLLLGASFGSQPSKAHGSRRQTVELKINNCTPYRIDRIYMTPVGIRGWGDDLLGSDTLARDSHVYFTLEAGDYDVKFVDEDKDECVTKKAVYRDTTWCIEKEWLLKCEGH